MTAPSPADAAARLSASSDPGIRQVACAGKTALFFSRRTHLQREAIKICDGCPVRDWCQSEYEAARAEFGIVTGVWAGVVHTHHEKLDKPVDTHTPLPR